MIKIIKIYKKKKKLIIGLMSGTSLDGIDASLVEVENSGIKTKFKELFFKSYPYPKELKNLILKNSLPNTSSVDEISTLNVLIGKFYATACFNLCREFGIDISQVDLIGSHGQTIHHLPYKKNIFGYEVSSTLQIGDPVVIAKMTDVVTVGDFRLGDMVLGGQGAPLIPYFDYINYRSKTKNVGLLNLGGIGNITVLKKKCKIEDVIAFDTGPGNMLIDQLMKKFYKKNFDKDGIISFTGKLNNELFNKIISKDNFLNLEPPKSTGREHYNNKFFEKILKGFGRINKRDIIRTFTEYTAYSVYHNYQKFIANKIIIDELIVSGGGAKNKYILNSLSKYFGDKVEVKTIDSKELSSDSKEAVCFAILANEAICGNPANIPNVTGAFNPTVLGKICY